MKKISAKILLLLFACTAMAGLNSQAQTLNEVLTNKETPIYYFGIDFTKAKLIGDAAAKADDIVARQFDGINDLMVNEAKKYDIAGAFRKDEMNSDLGFVSKRNQKRDPETLLSSSSEDYNLLKESDITSLVKGFNTGDKKGTGLLFVVDGMNKPKKELSVWVTLFDIGSKKILLTERVEGSVGMGFSFRNYWATGFKKVIDNIKNSKYAAWKSK
ncbi:hypothetical protein [Niabella drilacis]|uniref:Uncharacterized protein n=1 Tax=Niabella drilacis (strain DSM 25811 / CCM 8410 / CCUG 62505 / LMG 26954 / E90) TaxID=1285928 RepID=A0A1G6Q6G4_NIADE|nr:hypothetical protein [Niabella drilacis]SDC87811.1 hypothetical protein SAMN04487894_104293 [Niabella drilacis]